MPKVLKPAQKDRCIGCELCVFEAQRQLKKVGLEESLIRIFRKKSADNQSVSFELDIDPRVNLLNLEKITTICPRMVLEILEKEKDD